jgi:hypothetical protein
MQGEDKWNYYSHGGKQIELLLCEEESEIKLLIPH